MTIEEQLIKEANDQLKINIINGLNELDPDDRLEVFNSFCTDCGGDNPSCQCWNDE